MKVLDLSCDREHRFEGWFGSELDFQSQLERALLSCPVCDSKVVVRLPSAPRLNVSGAVAPASAPQPDERPADGAPPTVTADSPQQVQAKWLRAVHQVLRNTEDVGDRFPEEARRIHYGETKERGIRGLASPEDARALKDEGIEVAALPLPVGLKGTLQ